jgi:thiamine biosynthesis lipoprotein
MRRPTRRRVLKVAAFAGAGGLFAWWTGRAARPEKVRRTAALMGTTVHLTVVGPDRARAEAAAAGALARMAALEARLSRHRPDSEVGRLNRDGRLDRPSAELRAVLALADETHALAGGAFDVTILPVLALYRNGLPSRAALDAALARVGQDALRVDADGVRFARPGMALTLDGIGKGFVVDAGVDELRRHGFRRVLVEAGGDLFAAGRRWRIGIRHPRKFDSALLGRFEAGDVAVATSGDYFQPFTRDRSLHHILDPRTGVSAPGLCSATVLAPTAPRADALATLAMTLDPRAARELFEALPGCDALLVTKAGDVVRTTGFPPT